MRFFFTLSVNPKPFSSHWWAGAPQHPAFKLGGLRPPDSPNGGLRAAIKSAKFAAWAAHFKSILGSSFERPTGKIHFRETHPQKESVTFWQIRYLMSVGVRKMTRDRFDKNKQKEKCQIILRDGGIVENTPTGPTKICPTRQTQF